MIRKTLFATLALAASFAFAAEPAPTRPAFEVVGAEFGLFDAGRPDELVFEPARVVPHRVGQRYGWIIEVRTTKRSLAVREEYLLPGPAKAAADPAGTVTIPLDRRSQVSQRQLVPVNGRIYGEWAIGPGEPSGHRRLDVVVEGQLAASFEYEVR